MGSSPDGPGTSLKRLAAALEEDIRRTSQRLQPPPPPTGMLHRLLRPVAPSKARPPTAQSNDAATTFFDKFPMWRPAAAPQARKIPRPPVSTPPWIPRPPTDAPPWVHYHPPAAEPPLDLLQSHPRASGSNDPFTSSQEAWHPEPIGVAWEDDQGVWNSGAWVPIGTGTLGPPVGAQPPPPPPYPAACEGCEATQWWASVTQAGLFRCQHCGNTMQMD